MRRTDKEITDTEKIIELLTNAEVCRLGLVDRGYAYIVPVNYFYENSALYFHSSLKGRKMELLQENNKVSFEVDYSHGFITGSDACKCTTHYESVMGKGKAEFIEDRHEKAEILNKFMKKFRGDGFDIAPERATAVAVIKVNIESLSAKKSPA